MEALPIYYDLTFFTDDYWSRNWAEDQRFSNPDIDIYAPWTILLNARASVSYSFPLMELSRRPRHSCPQSWKFLDLLLDISCNLSPRSLHIQYHGYLHLLVIIIQLQKLSW